MMMKELQAGGVQVVGRSFNGYSFFLSLRIPVACLLVLLLLVLVLVVFNRSAVCRQGVGYRKWGEVLCPWNHLC